MMNIYGKDLFHVILICMMIAPETAKNNEKFQFINLNAREVVIYHNLLSNVVGNYVIFSYDLSQGINILVATTETFSKLFEESIAPKNSKSSITDNNLKNIMKFLNF